MPQPSRGLVWRAAPLLCAAVIAAALFITPLALAGGTTVAVRLTEFKVAPATTSVGHGKVAFVVRNAGTVTHEMVVIKTATKAAKLPVDGNGEASVRGSVGKVEVAKGTTKRLTLTLAKGHYVLLCNIGDHYMEGMRVNVNVT